MQMEPISKITNEKKDKAYNRSCDFLTTLQTARNQTKETHGICKLITPGEVTENKGGLKHFRNVREPAGFEKLC